MTPLSVGHEVNGELISGFVDDAIHLRSNGKVVRCHLTPKAGIEKAHFDAIQLIHKSNNNRQYALGEVNDAEVVGCVVAGRGTKVQCVFGSDGLYHNILIQHNTFSTGGEHYITLNGLVSGNISSNTFHGVTGKPIKLYPARIGGNPDGAFNVWVLDLPYQKIESDQPEMIQDLRQVVFNTTDKFLVDIDWAAFDRMVAEVPTTGGRNMGREFQRIAITCGRVVTEYQPKEVTPMMPVNKGTPYDIGQLYLGQEEIKGSAEHNPYIVEFFKTTSYKATDDETPWCLTGDIEVLTDKGFVRFDNFKHSGVSEVAQLNTSDNSVFFTPHFDYIEKDYDGVVYDIKSGKLDITCDPKHRMYGSWSGTGPQQLREVQSLTTYGVQIPPINAGGDGVIGTTDELVFMAAYLSDGHRKQNSGVVTFGVSKQRKIDILDTLEYATKKQDSVVYGVANYPITRYKFPTSRLRTDWLDGYKMLSWAFVKGMNQQQAETFINAYGKFDGTQLEGGCFEVFTSDKDLRDQLTYIATMAGHKSTPYDVKQVSPNTAIEYLYHVYISRNGKARGVKKKDVTERQYSGKLYCLTVPTSVMIIRCRNGVIIPIGNCSASHCYMHEQAGYAHTKSAAALSWKDWGVAIDKPTKECTIVADYGNGKGHVGFFMGETSYAYIIMGGNQGDAYCVAHYPKNAAYRWYFRKSKRAVNSKTNWTAGTGALAGGGITVPAIMEKLKPAPVVEDKPAVPTVSEQICEMQQCPIKIPEGYKAVPQEIYSVALAVGAALLVGSLFIMYERCKKIKAFGI